MEMLKENKSVLTDKETRRHNIIGFEEFLNSSSVFENNKVFRGDSPLCPLKHSFSDGIYVREITIPKGTLLVGKIHKHDHPNFLLKGEVVVYTEQNGEERLKAPCSMISTGGTKRALYAVTELVWTTIHHNPTNTQDLGELEKIVIASSFDEYDKFLLKSRSVKGKIKKVLIKNLSK
tara:strand:+ start:16010 stop:16540 length:531 start_codon:yes stop_codon:yes gene_type:complete